MGQFAFDEMVVLALNDSSASNLDEDGTDVLLEAVHEAMGCHESDCMVSQMKIANIVFIIILYFK